MERNPNIFDFLRVYWRLTQMILGFWLFLIMIPPVGVEFGLWKLYGVPEYIEDWEKVLSLIYNNICIKIGFIGFILSIILITVLLGKLFYKFCYNAVEIEHKCMKCNSLWAVYKSNRIKNLSSINSFKNFKTKEITNDRLGPYEKAYGHSERDLFKHRITKKETIGKLNICVVCGNRSIYEIENRKKIVNEKITAVGSWRKRK